MAIESTPETAGTLWKAFAFLCALLGMAIGIVILRNSLLKSPREVAADKGRTSVLVLRTIGVALIVLFGWGLMILLLSP